MEITEKQAQQISLGASLFSTGGGLPYSIQKKRIRSIFNGKPDLKISIINVHEISDEAYICTAYGVGSADTVETDLSKAFRAAFDKVKETSGHDIVGMFPGETNIESTIFEIASMLSLPVIDADGTGGRAVPELQIDDMFLAGKSTMPVIACTEDNVVHVIDDFRKTADEIEQEVRALTEGTKAVAVIDHIMSKKVAAEALTLGVLKRSLKYGRVLENSMSKQVLKRLVKDEGAKLLFDGTVENVNTFSGGGFYKGVVEYRNGGNVAQIHIKNENIVLEINGDVALTAPDLITVISKDTGRGIHNRDLRKGQNVYIIGIPATKKWRSKAGRKLFSPISVGLPFKQKIL